MTIKVSKEGSMLKFVDEEGVIAVYDFKDGSTKKTSKRSSRLREVSSLQTFFQGRTNYFGGIDWSLYEFTDPVYEKFIHHVAKQEGRCTNMGTFLNRISDHAVAEQYIACGYNISSFDPRIPLKSYPKRLLKLIKTHNMDFTRRLEMVVIDKGDGRKLTDLDVLINGLTYMESRLEMHEYIRHFSRQYTWSYSSVRQQVKDLIQVYNYEYKRLLEYAYIDLVQHENYPVDRVFSEIWDYARMQRVINMGGKFEKYPSHMRTMHDISAGLFDRFKKTYDDKMFMLQARPDLEYTTPRSQYKVIIPKVSNDLKREGSLLCHCVGSYIKRVIDGNSYIVFLRQKDDEEKPLVTIEVIGDRITQVRGLHNRSTSTEEKDFLIKYAEAKGLRYR